MNDRQMDIRVMDECVANAVAPKSNCLFDWENEVEVISEISPCWLGIGEDTAKTLTRAKKTQSVTYYIARWTHGGLRWTRHVSPRFACHKYVKLTFGWRGQYAVWFVHVWLTCGGAAVRQYANQRQRLSCCMPALEDTYRKRMTYKFRARANERTG